MAFIKTGDPMPILEFFDKNGNTIEYDENGNPILLNDEDKDEEESEGE